MVWVAVATTDGSQVFQGLEQRNETVWVAVATTDGSQVFQGLEQRYVA
jgi:hypothetical protein